MNTTTASDHERYAWIRLSLEPNLGADAARLLLANFGLPHQIYEQSVGTLNRFIPTALATQLRSTLPDELEAKIQATLHWLQSPDQHLICLADSHYPSALLTLADPPLILYAKGDLSQLQYPGLAIVGARSATESGKKNAYDFAQFLCQQGWSIISGLASGVDAAAHQGALAAQQAHSTIAVFGTGLDFVYPARNRTLAHQIAMQGLLLSEFPLGTRGLPHHFIRRNRLVAALAKGVLVVEAALKSGSLTTARFAADIGREVFAIPGSIHSPLHKGCHQLIRSGAKLVESAEHILEELQPTQPLLQNIIPPAATAPLSNAQQQLLDCMGYDPISADHIQLRSGLSTAQVGSLLVQLELSDHIIQHKDGKYQRR